MYKIYIPCVLYVYYNNIIPVHVCIYVPSVHVHVPVFCIEIRLVVPLHVQLYWLICNLPTNNQTLM